MIYLNKTITLLALTMMVSTAHAGIIYASPKSGVQDNFQAELIEKYNTAERLRNGNEYTKLASQLEQEIKQIKPTDYGYYRIQNELANIYSYHILDVERAISIDKKILKSNITDQGQESFVPSATVANQTVLASQNYIDDFIKLSSQQIKTKAKKRLEKNQKLLNGTSLNKVSKYQKSFLNSHIQQVYKDLEGVPSNSPKYAQLLSRLIRAEYEMYYLDTSYQFKSQKYFNQQFSFNDVDSTEINYVDFANYLVALHKQTRQLDYARQALQTIYRPYINLRNPQYRLNYNNLINQYIALLIDANYQQSNYEEMLYYISLNKSRMILEERLAYTSNNQLNSRISDLTANDGIPRDGYGLPTKDWFKSKIHTTKNFLDMYVDSSGTLSSSKNVIHTLANQTRPTRSIIRTSMDSLQDSASTNDQAYFTHIHNGQVKVVKKLQPQQVRSLQSDLEKAYSSVIHQQSSAKNNLSQSFGLTSSVDENLVISPDKWLSKYPYDYYFNDNTVRSVNLLTYNPNAEKISKIAITGFFNPTLDLSGTEYEAEIISNTFPSASVHIGKDADLSALKSSQNNNIVHLSMHGLFNEQDPVYSKLLFSGAKKAVDTTDNNSLYAKNIHQYQALKNQDLVFTAACQTGLTANSSKNQNEMLGILRPLIANGNKNVILSLWEVDDMATTAFVEAFYQHLSKTNDIDKSFSHAQNVVKQEYQKPYYWSAFYLLKAK